MSAEAILVISHTSGEEVPPLRVYRPKDSRHYAAALGAFA
jgi:hypothetical protein